MNAIEPSSRADFARSESALGTSISAALPAGTAVSTSAFDRVTAAVDASHYLLTPRAVVTPHDAGEVAALFAWATASKGVAVGFESLAAKAGVGLLRPQNIAALCCGTPWKSKGVLGGYYEMLGRTVEALWVASNRGELPIVCDNSSCSEGLVQALATAIEKKPDYRSMRIVDAVDFTAEHILPHLSVSARVGSVVVHPTCSSTRAGSNSNLTLLAAAVANEVTVPDDWGCCAFAGDRGMLHPELTASATEREAVEVEKGDHDAYVSCNRTCEIGMTRATGHSYQHVLEVLDRAT